uniref:Uncharacterized protein n=1 Tax=Octopus bimaculoides TaxID=37653 RepID=A0A0L8HFT3_OCTBM
MRRANISYFHTETDIKNNHNNKHENNKNHNNDYNSNNSNNCSSNNMNSDNNTRLRRLNLNMATQPSRNNNQIPYILYLIYC